MAVEITVKYAADDAYQFAQAHLSAFAWMAIDKALDDIRNHLKHDFGTADQCVREVEAILKDVRERLRDDPSN